MPVLFRIVLLLASLGTLAFVIWKVRRAQAQIGTAVFWILFAIVLVVFSIFPDLVVHIARLFGIDSPANFVFLFVLFIMIIKLFFMSMKLSMLQYKLHKLAQEASLNNRAKEEIDKSPSGESANEEQN